MNSIKCSQCGLINFAEAPNCRRCNSPIVMQVVAGFTPSAPGASHFNTVYTMPAEPMAAQPYAGQAAPTQLKTGSATASLVLGIVGCFSLGLFAIGSVIGLLLGIRGTIRAKREPERFGAKGAAIGGIVTNTLALLSIIPVALIAAIAIPNILAAQVAVNEATAITYLHHLAEAERAYEEMMGGNSGFATIDQLVAAGLITSDDTTLFGYTLELRLLECDGSPGEATSICSSFEIVASPVKYGSSGRRSFYVANDYVIRGGDKGGKEATEDDEPLKEFENGGRTDQDWLFD